MAGLVDPPPDLRWLGCSRTYSGVDTPRRLFAWNAPRSGRWVRLCVTNGLVEVEWRDGTAIRIGVLEHGTPAWFDPRTPWRLVCLEPETRFAIEVYSAGGETVDSLPPGRSILLDGAEQRQSGNPGEFEEIITAMRPSGYCIIHGRFDWHDAWQGIDRHIADEFFWHPMEEGDSVFLAFVARAQQPVGLADYLQSDHRVIESALAGFLNGNEQRARWLQNMLSRHIRIEEELLFPRYLSAGGRAPWVRSLETEHARLRRSLEQLVTGDPGHGFARALDDHDEKEERIIYPEILRCLGPDERELARQAFLFTCAP